MNVLNFDSKHCERIRGHLDAYLGNELLVETTSEVMRHAEACEACSRELDSLVRVREALRQAVRNELPPADLSAAVHQRLSRAQPSPLGGFRATRWVLVLAASLVLVFAGGMAEQWLRVQRGRQLVSNILELGVSGPRAVCD